MKPRDYMWSSRIYARIHGKFPRFRGIHPLLPKSHGFSGNVGSPARLRNLLLVGSSVLFSIPLNVFGNGDLVDMLVFVGLRKLAATGHENPQYPK